MARKKAAAPKTIKVLPSVMKSLQAGAKRYKKKNYLLLFKEGVVRKILVLDNDNGCNPLPGVSAAKLLPRYLKWAAKGYSPQYARVHLFRFRAGVVTTALELFQHGVDKDYPYRYQERLYPMEVV